MCVSWQNNKARFVRRGWQELNPSRPRHMLVVSRKLPAGQFSVAKLRMAKHYISTAKQGIGSDKDHDASPGCLGAPGEEWCAHFWYTPPRSSVHQ